MEKQTQRIDKKKKMSRVGYSEYEQDAKFLNENKES